MSCCPAFLLALSGPYILIQGAVFTDKFICQPLTDYIWIGIGRHLDQTHVNRVARILHALGRNVATLREYYSRLPAEFEAKFSQYCHLNNLPTETVAGTAPSVSTATNKSTGRKSAGRKPVRKSARKSANLNETPAADVDVDCALVSAFLDSDCLSERFYPSITSYIDPHSHTTIHFRYVKYLENESTCVTLLAKKFSDRGKDSDDGFIVVKFVDCHYGEDVHRFLAEQGLAPKLLYFGKVAPNGPTYGPYRMVVMDFVEGCTLAVLPENFLPAAINQLEKIVTLLHQNGFVYGDLRAPNVMITTGDKSVKLIDFDWAGKAGEAVYPALLSPSIKWPPGAMENGLITAEHDVAMIRFLREQLEAY